MRLPIQSEGLRRTVFAGPVRVCFASAAVHGGIESSQLRTRVVSDFDDHAGETRVVFARQGPWFRYCFDCDPNPSSPHYGTTGCCNYRFNLDMSWPFIEYENCDVSRCIGHTPIGTVR